MTPAVTIAAAATIVRRSAVAARRLLPIRAGGAGAMTRSRSSPRASVSTAKPAATTRNGLTRPKYWTATPDRAGPTTPPGPGAGDRPAEPGPARRGLGQPGQPRGPDHGEADPEPQPRRQQERERAGHRLCEHRDRHQPAGPEREPARAEPVGEGPGRHRDGKGGEPGRAEHHALLDAGQAELVGIDGKDRHHRVLGGGTGQDEAVDEEAEQPHRAGAAGGRLGRRPLQLAGLLLRLAGLFLTRGPAPASRGPALVPRPPGPAPRSLIPLPRLRCRTACPSHFNMKKTATKLKK